MRTVRSRVLNIIAAVEAMRERYPLLRQPVRAKHLAQLLSDHGIVVQRAPISDEAYVLGLPGTFVIVLRDALKGRTAVRTVLHEVGHIALHMSDADGVAKNLSPCRRGDPREAEAELFARLLYFGPDAGPDNNEPIADAIAAIEGARHLAMLPEQLALEMPERGHAEPVEPVHREHGWSYPMPHPAERPSEFRDLRKIFNDYKLPIGVRRAAWLEHVALQKKNPRTLPSHDSFLFDWSKEGKPLRYFHLQLGWVEIYDGMRTERNGRARWEILKCGDRRASRRTFVMSSSERRRYDFREGEKRGRSPKELDRQLARAKPFNQATGAPTRRNEPASTESDASE